MDGVLVGRRFFARIAFVATLVATWASSLVLVTPEPVRDLHSIRLALDGGDYAAAEQRTRSLIAILETSAPDASVETAAAIDLLVESLQRQQRGFSTEAREMAESALEIKERTLGSGGCAD